MKAKVTKAYTDRLDGVVRLPGESVELSEARAAELAAGGYVEVETAAAPPEKAEKVEKAGKPDYGSMSYADLKQAAKAAGIPATGKKADLAAALGAL